MKNIVSNIKHFALSLLVVGLAIATQSFVSENNAAKKYAKIYYQLPSGLYTSTPPSGDQCTEGSNPCTLNYPNSTPTAENFDYAGRPAGTVVESDPGIWQ